MELEIEKENVTINRHIGSKKEVVTIEGDVIIPDVKPDVLNIINATGNLCTYKKEVLDGKVKFDGAININVIYFADSDTELIRGLNTSLDYTKTIDMPDARSGMTLRGGVEIKNIEYKVLNGRKINIKVTLEIQANVYSNEEINILKDVHGIEDIQTMNSSIQINNLVGSGVCKANAKDTINLPTDSNLSEILKTNINLSNYETKVSYNKILIKADTNIKIMYLTDNGEIKTISSVIPLIGFIDINNVSENNIIDCNYEIKNIIVNPNSSEENSIYVEIEFEITCDVMDNKKMEIIQDMYCPNKKLTYNPKTVSTMSDKKTIINIDNIRDKISIPEILNNTIYDVDILPIINNANVLNGKIIYEGSLALNFIHSSNVGVDSHKHMLPFTFTIDNDNIDSSKVINTKVQIINDEFVTNSDETVDCKVDLSFETETYNNLNLQVIDDINIEDEYIENTPSMIIYIVKDGDTLWNIAKKYGTTIDEIVSVNNLENPNMIQIGQKLFLPRYCSKKLA